MPCYYKKKRSVKGRRDGLICNRSLIADGLDAWGRHMREFSLPEWDDLPGFELYMDQVIAILTQYLSFLPTEKTGDKVITPSAINNYVRMKIMPAPDKKKYSRRHIAYLIMICMLKQSMSISSVQKMIPAGLAEEQVKAIYNSCVAQLDKMTKYFVKHSRTVAEDMLGPGGAEKSRS